MASIDTAERTAQLESTLKVNVQPSFRALQHQIRYARFGVITLTTDSVTAADFIVLGSLGRGGIVVPEHSRLVGLSGSVQGTFKLAKANPAGTVTDLTGLATLATDATSVPFLRKAGSVAGAAFAKEDVLRLIIGTATALTAGDTIELCLAYISDEDVN